MLELKNVSYSYTSYRLFGTRTKQVLRHINLRMQSHQSLAIMGQSGCGKSTLAKIACGLLHPSKDENGARGVVEYNSALLKLKNIETRRDFYRQVQILFQDCIGSLNPYYSCLENCLESLQYLSHLSKEESIARLKALARDLALPEDIFSRQVGSISGGEAQRICLIRALCVEPKLLILDENTSGLDYELSLAVVEYLKQWQKRTGVSILLITHDEEVARRLCDDVRVMSAQGELES
ncbi:ATP-binding cassette domain-containing protein [Helicobacter typhlonius]|uniref:ATP-binding cassette domain-containing protein n=1 Tax=Helicobacter typhlonius TaxID=76936 RepID=UPI002FE2ED8F